MQKSNIGIDLDGVICNLYQSTYPLLKELYGIDTDAKPLKSVKNSWEKEFNLTEKQVSDTFILAGSRGIYRNAPVYEETRRHLVNISRQYNIYYVTVRDFYPNIRKDTFYWLDKNKLPYYRVVFSRSKHKIAEREQFQFFIDDDPNMCNRVAKTSVPTWIMRRPYNDGAMLDPLIKIANNWKEIEDILIVEK